MLFVLFIFQSNVIEAPPDMQSSTEKEWYYGNVERERLGPFSFAEVRNTSFTHRRGGWGWGVTFQLSVFEQ